MWCARAGAPLTGVLEMSGIGKPISDAGFAEPMDQRECRKHNDELFQIMEEDPFHNKLFSAAMADAELGRMSAPVEGKLCVGVCCALVQCFV